MAVANLKEALEKFVGALDDATDEWLADLDALGETEIKNYLLWPSLPYKDLTDAAALPNEDGRAYLASIVQGVTAAVEAAEERTQEAIDNLTAKKAEITALKTILTERKGHSKPGK